MNEPQVLPNVNKIVLAGMKLLYAKQTESLRDALLAAKGDPVERIASNVTGLMQMLWEKSGEKLPPKDISPAALMLVYEVASFMKEAGVEVTQEDLDQCVPLTMQMLKELFTKLLGGQQAPQEAQPAQPPMPPQQPQGLLAQGAM